MKKFFFIKILSFIFLVSSNFSYADTLKISSKKLEVLRKEGLSVFTGNVYAVDKTMKIWSEKLSVLYDDKIEKIKEIIAEENVKIIRDDLEAYGDYSSYKPKINEMFLSGNITVIQDNNRVQCDQLTIDLESSTSIMTANNGNRVRVKIENANE
tara:strand:+ start:189 stop:650 length:462 start_codon:yes stop_codon:yes gene_type:complete